MKPYKKVLWAAFFVLALIQIVSRISGTGAEERLLVATAGVVVMISLLLLSDPQVEAWVEKYLNLDDPSNRDSK